MYQTPTFIISNLIYSFVLFLVHIYKVNHSTCRQYITLENNWCCERMHWYLNEIKKDKLAADRSYSFI